MDLFCFEKCGQCKCEKVNTFSNEGVPFLQSADAAGTAEVL